MGFLPRRGSDTSTSTCYDTGKFLCFGEVVAYERGGATMKGSTAEAFL